MTFRPPLLLLRAAAGFMTCLVAASLALPALAQVGAAARPAASAAQRPLAVAPTDGEQAAAPPAWRPGARPALTQLKLQSWQVEQGLPMNTVQALLHAREGSLWVGTGAGLARFDGQRFVTLDGAPVTDLSGRSVFGLHQSKDGAIWIGHTRGAARFHDGRFEPTLDAALTGGRRIWSFAETPAGDLYAASENGLVHWKAGKGRVLQEADGLPTRRLRTLALAPDGTLWIGTTGGGLVAWREGRVEVFDRSTGFPHPEVRAVLTDRDGGVWAATAGAGLVHLHEGRLRIYTTDDGLPTNHLTALARGADGALWIGTWGHGLVRHAEGRFETLDETQGLGGNQVWSLHADAEGSVWVGTWHGGLNRLVPRPFTLMGRPEGLSGDNIRAVLPGRDGAVWLALAGGGVNRLHTSGITAYGRAQGLRTDEVSALHEDPDGSLWVATYTEGVARLKDDRLQTWGTAEGLPHPDVRTLLRTRDGTLWAGTRAGLARLEGNRFAPVREPGAPAEGVNVMLEARDGTLWIGTAGEGLVRFRGGRFETLTRAQGLLSNWIMALHEDRQGTLWIGTNGEGLNRLRGDRISSIQPSDGLWDGLVQVLLEDRQGRLWMTSNRGFFRADLAELDAFAEGRVPRIHTVAYGSGDALRSSTFAGGVQSAGAVDAQGHLWLPSVKGVVVVDPQRLPDQVPPPPPRITEVSVDGRVQPVQDRVRVARDASSLTIDFGAATLLPADRVRFRYRLEGLTPGWVDVGTRHEATFAGLPPGTRRFEVATSVDGQRWHERAAALTIEVQPRLHQTPAFLAAAGLLAVALVGGAHQLRTRQLRRRSADMERLVAQKTDELRLANEHLQRLSFADALTGLPNRRRLDEVLASEWRRAARQGQPMAAVMADIDAFKAYNDHMGHLQADQGLIAVAEVIRQTAHRAGDFAARFGGEEFVILLPGADLAAARGFAERLRAAIEARALPHPASSVGPVLTVSLGVASRVPHADEAPSTLLAEADAALYRAKQDGRNRVA